MSTKSTIQHGDNYHLYREVMEDDGVYLHLSNATFTTCSSSGVTVKIPAHIFNVLLRAQPIALPYAGWTDAQLRQHAVRKVRQRIKEYQLCLRNAKKKGISDTTRHCGWIAFCGSFVYGDITRSEKAQVATAMRYFRCERDRQTVITSKVAELWSKNKPAPRKLKG